MRKYFKHFIIYLKKFSQSKNFKKFTGDLYANYEVRNIKIYTNQINKFNKLIVSEITWVKSPFHRIHRISDDLFHRIDRISDDLFHQIHRISDEPSDQSDG